jgi:hypothetical protein
VLSAEYLAGFFDGEGCVSVRGNGYLSVTFSGGHTNLLTMIKADWGGSLHVRPNGIGSLQFTTRQAVAVLQYMLPHLIIKREVALLGIQLGTFARGVGVGDRDPIRRSIHEANLVTSPRSARKGRFER